MRLKNLAEHPAVREAWIADPEFQLRGLACDSRLVTPGGAFYALRGFAEDGHGFVPGALEAGAAVLLVSDGELFQKLKASPPAGLAGVLRVPAGRQALADVANALADHPSRELSLLAVTGTSGKTTVSCLVAQLYQVLGKPCGVIGSLGMMLGDEVVDTGRTTPEAPVISAFLRKCVDRGVRHAVIEATSIGIDLERTRGLVFKAAAFTNLGRDHLDYHGTLEAYAAAKQRLFLENDLERAVVNLDDPAGELLLARIASERPKLPPLTYGLCAGAQLRAEDVTADARGSRGEICFEGRRAAFEFVLPGGFNLSNLLSAVGLLLAVGESLEDAAAAAKSCRGVAGRFELVPCGPDFTAVVDYSHKPEALENALRTARQIASGRVLVVFGCGGGRDTGKRPQMGEIAQRLADRVIITSDNPRDESPRAIMAEIAAGLHGSGGVGEVVQIEDRREAIRHALGEAAAGDVVLIAGKGNEAYQEIAGAKLPFDDREEIRVWVAERGGWKRARN